MTKILISAGEASGDLHAGAVTRAIRQLDPSAEVFGMGGDCMREAGGEVLFDIKDHSVMGFVEVLKKLPDIWKLRSSFIALMDSRKPDVLLTIDYPGFNMRLAKLAKERGIKVVSFIAPSAWAWRPSRAAGVVKVVDKIASISPLNMIYINHTERTSNLWGILWWIRLSPPCPVKKRNVWPGSGRAIPLSC